MACSSQETRISRTWLVTQRLPIGIERGGLVGPRLLNAT